MSSEVTECADLLLEDFRNSSSNRRAKETDHNKLQEQFNKITKDLKRQFSGAQNEAKLLQEGIDALMGSAPSDEALEKFCNENAAMSVDAVTLDDTFVLPAAFDPSIHARDCESVEAFVAGLKQAIADAH